MGGGQGPFCSSATGFLQGLVQVSASGSQFLWGTTGTSALPCLAESSSGLQGGFSGKAGPVLSAETFLPCKALQCHIHTGPEMQLKAPKAPRAEQG